MYIPLPSKYVCRFASAINSIIQDAPLISRTNVEATRCSFQNSATPNFRRGKKPLLFSIESWLVYRDPYFMAYEIVPKIIWVGKFIPYITLTNQGPIFSLLKFSAGQKNRGHLQGGPLRMEGSSQDSQVVNTVTMVST